MRFIDSVIVGSFKGLGGNGVHSLVVYRKPKDFPNNYVVRLWRGIEPTPFITISNTLEEARRTIPSTMYRLARNEYDDAVVVEAYI